MRKLVLFSSLAMSVGSVFAQDAPRPGDSWQVPSCKAIAGTNSIAITSDEGATLLTPGRPLRPTSYAYGLAVLPDAPNTMLLSYGRTLQRSTTAGCRWTTVGTVASTSDGFPISLVAARGDRAFAWSENRNDLARIDGTTITYLGSPVDSIVGVGTDPVDADRVRFGDGSGQLWESNDAGLRFSPLGTRIPGSSFLYYRAAFDPRNLDHVVVGAVTSGAFVTFDGGRSWTQATGLSSTGTGSVNVFSVVVSPADSMTVYAMGLDIAEMDAGAPSQGRHIYMSKDGGITFTPVVDRSSDVILPNGVPMAGHPTNANVVYFTYGSSFGGYGADLYRYDDATGQVTKTHNDYHGLPSIAFNPADASTMYLGLALESVN
jgi:hypothetical protein